MWLWLVEVAILNRAKFPWRIMAFCFLDELPEFKRTVLEVMRQPMEERRVTISRAKVAVDFPASFMLIASMNPCPCGFYNHPEKECTCPPGAVQKYLNKISGPLLDRIDLHVEVTPVAFSVNSHQPDNGESSADIRERVIKAREMQAERYKDNPGIYCNAQMSSKMLKGNLCDQYSRTKFIKSCDGKIESFCKSL